jgi:TonB-like protein
MWNREKDNLVICLALSVALHLLLFVFIVVLGGTQLLAHLFHPKVEPEEEDMPKLVLLQRQPPPPQEFMETDASQESKTRPKQSPFYSERNTLAQDQSARSDQNRPEIKGRDKNFPATEDVTLSKNAPPSPPTPATPAKPPSKPAQPEKQKPAPKPAEKAQPAPSQDDLVKKEYAILKPKAVEATPAHPDDVPVEAQQAEPAETPTPEQARAPPVPAQRPPVRAIPTQASSLTGGISRKGIISFDTQESPAGYYDKVLLQTITQRWYMLIGDRYRNQAGNVKIEFDLLSDGQVSNVQVQSDDSIGPLLANLCREAIVASAPYRPFPPNLQPLWGDTRHIKITFQYSF